MVKRKEKLVKLNYDFYNVLGKFYQINLISKMSSFVPSRTNIGSTNGGLPIAPWLELTVSTPVFTYTVGCLNRSFAPTELNPGATKYLEPHPNGMVNRLS